MTDTKKESKKVFIIYLDDDDRLVKGKFELLTKNESYIEIVSDKNKITIPMIRVRKIKETIE